MTAVLIALGVLLIILLFQREREQTRQDARETAIALERQRNQAERKELLERIQHPERIYVSDTAATAPPEPPRDAAELALVGQEVPSFVQVGSEG